MLDNKINQTQILHKFREVVGVIYQNWWAERNGGNISVLLDDDFVKPFIKDDQVLKSKTMSIACKQLANRYILVTGSGKYYRNIAKEAETTNHAGIIKINATGEGYDVVWGFNTSDCWPTSELPSHLMSHVARLSKDANHKVVIHSHPTDLIALTFTEEMEEKDFTLKMWRMISEASVVFPEGLGIVPWMLPGSNEVAKETATKMLDYKAVIWVHHGLFCSGTDLDEALGLLECVEKSAKIYLKILQTGKPILTQISNQNIKDMADFFGFYQANPKFTG